METHRYKNAFGDFCKVTTDLIEGDQVQIKLSNAVILIDEIFALDHDKYWRNSEGLHIRGEIIHDGTHYNQDKGKRSYSIPVANIAHKIVEPKIENHA
jgi:hypothetical protein